MSPTQRGTATGAGIGAGVGAVIGTATGGGGGRRTAAGAALGGAAGAIVDHTDNTGSDSINDPLSMERAARTRDYLVTRGVASGRFTVDGRGSREPVASNNTAAGRAKNRRVEIFVAEPQQK